MILNSLQATGERAFDLLAYGDPNVDYVFEAARIPAADEKLLGRNLGLFAGGTVANVASAAARLGARVAGFGRVGQDPDGAFLLAANTEFGVSSRHLVTTDARTAAASIMVDSSGEKALIYAPMPGRAFDAERLSLALAESRIIYAMPYDLEEFEMVSARARAANVLVAIDIEAAVAPDPQRLHALLKLSDIVFMNEGGLRATQDQPIGAGVLEALARQGPKVVVVTLGARGAVAFSEGDYVEHPAFQSRLVDATGAGDCFNGAFLAALLNGGSLVHCTRFACAAASFAVSAVGARTAIPHPNEVLARMSENVKFTSQIVQPPSMA